MTEFAAVVDLIQKGGYPFIIAVLVLGSMRRWFVWGWVYDAQQKQNEKQIEAIAHDRDGWRTIAERGTSDVKAMVEWAQDRAKEAKE